MKLKNLLAKILPQSVRQQAETESRDWYFTCSCGHEFDVWSIGGVRYGAAGNPRRLVTCPKCQKTSFLKLKKRE